MIIFVQNAQQSTNGIAQKLSGYSNTFGTNFTCQNIKIDLFCFQESGSASDLGKLNTSITSIQINVNAWLTDNNNPNDRTALFTFDATGQGNCVEQIIHSGLNWNRECLIWKNHSTIIANVHLTSGNPKRAKDEFLSIINLLENKYKNRTCAIVGDLNFDLNSESTLIPNGWFYDNGGQHQSGKYLDWVVSNKPINVFHRNPYYMSGSDHPYYIVDIG